MIKFRTWGNFGNINHAIGYYDSKPYVIGNIHETPELEP